MGNHNKSEGEEQEEALATTSLLFTGPDLAGFYKTLKGTHRVCRGRKQNVYQEFCVKRSLKQMLIQIL